MELDTEVDIEDIFDEDWDAIEEEEDFDGKPFLVLIFFVFRSQVTIISKSPPMILVWDLAELAAPFVSSLSGDDPSL